RLLCQRSFAFGCYNKSLSKPRHFLVFVLLIELDHVLETMHARSVAKFLEIGIQIGLELVHEYEQLCVAEFAKTLYVCRIDEDRALRFHRGEHGLHKTVNRLAETEI